MALNQRVGTIKCWFNGEDGYGFIRADDRDEVVFVHHTGVVAYTKANSLSEGVRVTYEVVRRKMGGLWAKDVCRKD